MRDGLLKGLAPFQLAAVETQMQRYAGLAAHPGSGLGGGQWAVVSALIATYCPNAVLVRFDTP